MNNSGKSVFGLEPNVAAGLAYIPVLFCHLIVSIGILATDRSNKLPRFHAIQSLMLSASVLVGGVIFFIFSFVIIIFSAAADVPALSLLAFAAYFVFLLYVLLVAVGLIIGCIKAFQGQIFRLPIIGSLADKWSN